MSQCAIDGSETGDGANLCRAHRDRLCDHLSQLPDIEAQLTITLTRQTAGARRHGSRSSSKPLPFDAKASETLTDIHGVLVGWVRVLHDDREDDDWPDDEIRSMAGWLKDRMGDIAQHEAAGDIAREIEKLTIDAWKCIDRYIPFLIYAGSCGVPDEAGYECEADVYAKPDATAAVCPGCGITHDVDERRDTMKAALRDMLLTTGQCVIAVRLYEAYTTVGALQKWAQRDRIHHHGHDRYNRPLYLVSEVLALAEEAAKRGRAA